MLNRRFSFPSRRLIPILLLLAVGFVFLFARPTVAHNVWSLRFVNATWGGGPPAPPPPATHPHAERWLAEQAGIAGNVLDAANRLNVLAATGDRFSRRSFGHMLAAQGDVGAGYALWEELGDYNSAQIWVDRQLARGDADGAYEGLRVAYRISPSLGTKELASFLRQNHAEEEAIRVLQDAQRTSAPDHRRARWLDQLAASYIDQEAWQAAEQAYGQLATLPGRQLTAYLGLARLAYARYGSYGAAEPYLARARAAAPYDGSPFFETGQYLSREQRYSEADPWYRLAQQKEPNELSYHLAYAVNSRNAGAYPTAIARYQSALTRFPEDARLYAGLAKAHELNGDLPAARTAMDYALRLSAPPPVAYWLQAAALAEADGDRDAALDAYGAVLAEDRDNVTAQRGLERLQRGE